jgi:hypothetical protein
LHKKSKKFSIATDTRELRRENEEGEERAEKNSQKKTERES